MADVKIKLCGMFRDCDIDYANAAMPDYIGFIIDFPKSHRSISPDTAKRLKARLSDKIKAVGVFVNAPVGDIAGIAADGAIDMIQLHGGEDAEYIARLKTLVTLPIIKAVKVTASGDITAAASLGADRLLLDGGMGGGRMFDHSLIDCDISGCFLAGGLTVDNLVPTAQKFAPYALDISSGIETDGVKDREKMITAVNTVREYNERNR